ncbi:hypothetical protein MKW92_006739, partial [Papaver armeniacum]
LPRLFCSFCHRLGHEHQDCIDVVLLNNQHMLPQPPSPALPQPDLHALGPFVEPEYDDDYYEKMIHNVDFEDPDPEWSDWGSNPFGSPASSDQNKSAISFFDGEGYRKEGFHSDSSSEYARTISEAWLVESNNVLEDPINEIMPLPSSQPSESADNLSVCPFSWYQTLKNQNYSQILTFEAQP